MKKSTVFETTTSVAANMVEGEDTGGSDARKSPHSTLQRHLQLGTTNHFASARVFERSKSRSPRPPTDSIDAGASREHLNSQLTPAETLDSVFELSSQTIKSLNDAVKREKSPVLLALLIELCSISGLLFQLKRLSQEAKSPREWGETVSAL